MNKLLIFLLLTGCSSSYIYELSKTQSSQNKTIDEMLGSIKQEPCEKDSQLTPKMSLSDVREIMGRKPDLTSYRPGFLTIEYMCKSYYNTNLLSLNFEEKDGNWYLFSWNSLGI